MSNLQTYYHFKLDFQKVDQHTGGKWLIHLFNHTMQRQPMSAVAITAWKVQVSAADPQTVPTES